MAVAPRLVVRTRDRVLDSARDLLNAHGFDRVTTRMIADAAGINEGNLYYHFRTKQALHLALVDRLAAQAVALLSAPCDYGSMAFFDTLLRDLLSLAQQYRFLFIDLSPILGSPALAERVRRLGDGVQVVVEQAVEEMKAHGLIDCDRAERDRLLANSWIVSTYWAHYLVLRGDVRAPSEVHLTWAIEQVRSLYEPYFTAQGRSHLAMGNVPP